MLRMKWFAAAVAVVAAATVPAGASADVNKVVGDQLPLSGSSTFPAGQPFHIAHGWLNAPASMATVSIPHQSVGEYQVRVTVDGVEVKPSFIETTTSIDPIYGIEVFQQYVFNFPDGMTGTHVFGTTFLGPCQGLVDSGFATGPCDQQNDLIPTSSGTFYATVTFVP
jgi:hypothetical protein